MKRLLLHFEVAFNQNHFYQKQQGAHVTRSQLPRSCIQCCLLKGSIWFDGMKKFIVLYHVGGFSGRAVIVLPHVTEILERV